MINFTKDILFFKVFLGLFVFKNYIYKKKVITIPSNSMQHLFFYTNRFSLKSKNNKTNENNHPTRNVDTKKIYIYKSQRNSLDSHLILLFQIDKKKQYLDIFFQFPIRSFCFMYITYFVIYLCIYYKHTKKYSIFYI